MNKDNNKVSAVIITYNEEENIFECLKSVKWADEIIVVDSYSTDNTVKLCKSFSKNIKVIRRKWNCYSAQKNFAVSKTKNNWILSVDADERITSDLKKEILNMLKKDEMQYYGYKIPRKNYYFGKWIRWGGNYPDYQIRFYNKKHGKFKNVPIHEGVVIKGSIGVFINPMLHYSYTSINNYFKRFIAYTDIEMKLLASKKTKINLLNTFKYIFFIPIKKTITRYIFKFGFLDGIDGLLILKLNNITKIIAYYKYYLLCRKSSKKK